jgi:hypothetical protein
MKATHIPFAGILLLVFVLGACREPSISRSEDGLLFLGSDEASDTIERVIAPGGRSLILEGIAGSIRLSGTDSDVARLTVTRRARGDSPEEANSQLRSLDVEETGDETSYRYRFTASDRSLSRFDIEGTVPTDTPIRIRWVAGGVVLREISGDVDVQTQHGGVSYSGPANVVHLRSRNGSVKAQLWEVSAGADVDLLTANGDVSAALPHASSAHVEARTSAGSISTSQMTFVSESLSLMNAGARFQARMGEGAGRVALSTQHGSIDISSFVPDVKEIVPGEHVPTLDQVVDIRADTAVADTVIAESEPATADTMPAEPAPVDSLR